MLLLYAIPIILLFITYVVIRETHIAKKNAELNILYSENDFLKKRIEFLTISKEENANSLREMCQTALLQNQKEFLGMLDPVITSMQTKTTAQFQEQKMALQVVTLPIGESLKKINEYIKEIEIARNGAYHSVISQMKEIQDWQSKLHKETSELNSSLRNPNVRGAWGEMQLRRVIEISGMLSYCDFSEQSTLRDEKGYIRPDLIVNLPGNKRVIVDAKTPISHYLEAMSAINKDDRSKKMEMHAKRLCDHIRDLSDKQYWKYNDGPEFVLLFIPGESFLSAALDAMPSIIDFATEKDIILATPTTLIALLKTIAHGWKNENISQHTKSIVKLSDEIVESICSIRKEIDCLNKNISQSNKICEKIDRIFIDNIENKAKKLSSIERQDKNASI